MNQINYGLIQDFITSNKLSKSGFCKNCGISLNTLNNIFFNNVAGLRYTTFRKICLFTKIDANRLFKN